MHKDSTGYLAVSQGAGKKIRLHRILAEKALGKPLPIGAVIHHHNKDRMDASPDNLVICQDAKYHKLLHTRMRIREAGGNPNSHRICSCCKKVLPLNCFGNLKRNASGKKCYCKRCACDKSMARYRKIRNAKNPSEISS